MTEAVARLRALPGIFTFAGFCRFSGFSANAAAVCLRRWKLKGLIEVAGERAGIYFNMLKTPQVDGSHRVTALLFEYPSALLCGESVLHAAGWISRMPARLSVAVISRPSYVCLHGIDIRGRPLSWFRKVHPAVNPDPPTRIYGLRALPPAVALADLYAHPKAWHPDPADLDIPPEEAASLQSAGALLRAHLPRRGRIPATDLPSGR